MTRERLVEDELREIFDENYERLRAESGHALSPEVKENAWRQVQYYWRKLRQVAESVTDTEVRLSLPNQTTPRGRRFCIEGVVDIVREGGRTTMYDFKTHELKYVRENVDYYRRQLNVYAHIWQNLREERLDETAVIATPLPQELMDAIRANDPERLDRALHNWDPVVPIEFDAQAVEETVEEFGKVVDQIEDHAYTPMAPEELARRAPDGSSFAMRVCVDCDLRYSCRSFVEYAKQNRDRRWKKLAMTYDFPPVEEEEEERLEIMIDTHSDGELTVSDL